MNLDNISFHYPVRGLSTPSTVSKLCFQITYPSGVEVNLGNELKPTQVKDKPTVQFEADPHKFYTLVMTDPDAPSRIEPTYREFKHWVVVNIPGSDVAQGEELAEFVGSGPPMGTGLHRYVFLVYEQPKKLPFTGEPRTTKRFVQFHSIAVVEGVFIPLMILFPFRSRESRPKFSVKTFAYRNQLGEPIAGNYYQAQFDDYVPLLHQQLSGL